MNGARHRVGVGIPALSPNSHESASPHASGGHLQIKSTNEWVCSDIIYERALYNLQSTTHTLAINLIPNTTRVFRCAVLNGSLEM